MNPSELIKSAGKMLRSGRNCMHKVRTAADKTLRRHNKNSSEALREREYYNIKIYKPLSEGNSEPFYSFFKQNVGRYAGRTADLGVEG